MPASARLATVATVIGDERRAAANGLLPRPAAFEFRDARFEFGELCLCALKQLLLHFEVLAQHEVEPVEPGREKRLQISLDVLRRGAAQRLVDARAQVVQETLVDHDRNLAPSFRT